MDIIPAGWPAGAKLAPLPTPIRCRLLNGTTGDALHVVRHDGITWPTNANGGVIGHPIEVAAS